MYEIRNPYAQRRERSRPRRNSRHQDYAVGNGSIKINRLSDHSPVANADQSTKYFLVTKSGIAGVIYEIHAYDGQESQKLIDFEINHEIDGVSGKAVFSGGSIFILYHGNLEIVNVTPPVGLSVEVLKLKRHQEDEKLRGLRIYRNKVYTWDSRRIYGIEKYRSKWRLMLRVDTKVEIENVFGFGACEVSAASFAVETRRSIRFYNVDGTFKILEKRSFSNNQILTATRDTIITKSAEPNVLLILCHNTKEILSTWSISYPFEIQQAQSIDNNLYLIFRNSDDSSNSLYRISPDNTAQLIHTDVGGIDFIDVEL